MRQIALTLLPSDADVVLVLGASTAAIDAVDELIASSCAAAAVAVELLLEIVEVGSVAPRWCRALLVDVLNQREQLWCNERLVPPLESLAFVADESDVVRVAQDAMPCGVGNDLGIRVPPGDACAESTVGHGLGQALHGVVAGGVQLEALPDEAVVPGYLAYSRFRARLGQRYLHLYIRDAKTTLARDRGAVFIGFFERPPGSVAVATTSSVASTILIIAAGYMQAKGLNFNGDIVAVMLAFPFIVASGVGIDRNSGPLSRSVMLAKFGAFATACFSTIAAISVVGYQRFQFGERFSLLGSTGSWLVLVFLSTLTSSLMLGSWISRSALYYSFLRRDALADFNEVEVN